ncbi:MAG: hypothetical protein KBD93_06290 [Streptococcus sp.]|nr:hypothetical protein [Streptococcus sp.]
MNEVTERGIDIRLNILVSMAILPKNFDKFIKDFKPIIETIILDNGAYSVMNANLGITAENLYARFKDHCKVHQDRYLMIFSPDFNFSPDGFEENYEKFLDMQELGIDVVPVIHNLKNGEIDEYLSHYPEYMAIGQSKNRRIPSRLFPHVYRLNNHGVKVHLFGITQFNLLAGCPAYSCDSKSWLDDATTGVVRFWNPERQEQDKTDPIYFPDYIGQKRKGTISRYDYQYMDVFEAYAKSRLGLTIDDFLGLNAVLYRELANAVYYSDLSKIITDIHISDGILL